VLCSKCVCWVSWSLAQCCNVTDYVIPDDINPVTHGDDIADDEWEDDITIISADVFDASLEAAENFDDFIRAEKDQVLILQCSTVNTVSDISTMNNNVSVTSQSHDHIEEDKFLESINWDEVLTQTLCRGEYPVLMW